MSQVIVIGGGLSGASAANTVLERGGRVLLLDKNAFCGGTYYYRTCLIFFSLCAMRELVEQMYVRTPPLRVTLKYIPFGCLLDHSPGNSVKATSGINGAGTSTQFANKIADNAEEFYKDIWYSAAGAYDAPRQTETRAKPLSLQLI